MDKESSELLDSVNIRPGTDSERILEIVNKLQALLIKHTMPKGEIKKVTEK